MIGDHDALEEVLFLEPVRALVRGSLPWRVGVGDVGQHFRAQDVFRIPYRAIDPVWISIRSMNVSRPQTIPGLLASSAHRPGVLLRRHDTSSLLAGSGAYHGKCEVGVVCDDRLKICDRELRQVSSHGLQALDGKLPRGIQGQVSDGGGEHASVL